MDCSTLRGGRGWLHDRSWPEQVREVTNSLGLSLVAVRIPFKKSLGKTKFYTAWAATEKRPGRLIVTSRFGLRPSQIEGIV